MTKGISSRQMLFAVSAFILASSLLTKGLYDYTKNETWLAVILAGFIGFAVIAMYSRLAGNHPGASLVDINIQVFGSILGRIVTALYVFFFLSLTVLNTQDLGGFVSSAVLPNTPINVSYFLFLGVCVYAVKKGASAVTRYGTVITIVYIALLVFNSLLVMNKTHLESLLPALTLPVKNYLLSAHLTSMLPFCEIFVFIMFAPYMQQPSELGKTMRRGFIIGAATILFIIIRDTSVLGGYTAFASMPTYAAVRLIDVGDILTRLEIIYAVTLIVLLFFKVSVLLFATVTSFSKLFGIEKHGIFALVMGVLIIVGAGTFFQESAEHVKWFATAATYSTFFLFILPAVTLIVSEIRKKAGRDTPNAQTSGDEYIC